MIYQEKIFTREECDKIISFSKKFKANKKYREAEKFIDYETNRVEHVIKSENTNEKLGKYFFVHDIIRETDTEWMFDKLINWFSNKANIELNPNLTVNHCSLLNYKKGDFFMRHTDIYKNFEFRRYTLNIQLDNKYQGGDYVIYLNNEEIILNKEPGTAIAYWSGYEHEVKEIEDGERWSIVLTIPKQLILEKNKTLI